MAMLAPQHDLLPTPPAVPVRYAMQASAVRLLEADLYWLETHGLCEPDGAIDAAMKNHPFLAALFRDLAMIVKKYAPTTHLHILTKAIFAIARTEDIILLLDNSYLFQERTLARVIAEAPDAATAVIGMQQRGAIITNGVPFIHLTQCMRQLTSFRDLQPGWNGYDSRIITPQAIASARGLLTVIFEQLWYQERNDAFPDVIVPVPNGGVQFEWRREPLELEVSIGPTGGLGYLLNEQNGDTASESEAEQVSRTEIIRQIAAVVLAP